MSYSDINIQNINIEIMPEMLDTDAAARLASAFSTRISEHPQRPFHARSNQLTLKLDTNGLSLISGNLTLRGDYSQKLPRLAKHNLSQELIIRAAKIRSLNGPLTAIDATAGLGEDSLLLAAAGFEVTLYERNPVIFELLQDTISRALDIPELAEIVSRMHIFNCDSIDAMKNTDIEPAVIFLDPMFPERQKSSLVKKKLQVIQELELPEDDEASLIHAAVNARPQKLIIKRPIKGAYLAGIKPDYSLLGKALRFDCFTSPYDHMHKFDFEK